MKTFIEEYKKELVESKEDQERFKKWIGLDKINGKSVGEIYFDKFLTYKQRIKSPFNDLYYWMKNGTPEKFKKYIDELDTVVANKQNLKRLEKEGGKLIYSDDTWKVYHIINYEASAKYGKGTKWCITGTERWNDGNSGKETFEQYHDEHGVEFYFFIKNNGEKYALALYPDKNHYEIYNAEDVKIAYIEDAPKIEGLPDVSTKEDWKVLINAIMNGEIDEVTIFDCMQIVLREEAGMESFITTDKEAFASALENFIPDGYLEYEAVETGELTPEEYKAITGEEYKEGGWSGDYPWFAFGELESISGTTKKEKCDARNFDEHKYWLLVEKDVGYEIYYSDDYVGLYLLMNSLVNTDDWSDDEIANFFDGEEGSRVDIVASMIANTLIKEIKQGRISKDVISNLGLSDDFLNSLDESLKEDLKESSNVLYHGTLDKFDRFDKPINWLTSDYDYAKYYALSLRDKGLVYTCEADISNLYDIGHTGKRVFELLPVIPPFKVTKDFKRVMNDLEISDEESEDLLSKVIEEFNDGYNGYKTMLSTVARSKAFRDLLVSRGYDGIKAIEYNVPKARYCDTYGIFDGDFIEIKDVKEVSLKESLNVLKEDKSQDIIDFVEEKIGVSSTPIDGPSYIMPSGKFLTIWKSNIPVSKYSATGSATHRDVQDFLYDNNLVKDRGIDVDTPELEELGCIRVNSGFEEYIWMPDTRPNEVQWNSLLVWLDWYFKFHHKVGVGFKGQYKTYRDKDYTTDEIIDKIKQAYATRYLSESYEYSQESYESIDKSLNRYFNEDLLRKLFSKYIAPANHSGKCFITRDGTIYNVDAVSVSHMGCLYEMFHRGYLEVTGKYLDTVDWDNDDLEDLYSDIQELAYWKFGWIQCSSEYGYTAINREPTSAQYKSLEEWMYNRMSAGDKTIQIDAFKDAWAMKMYQLGPDCLPEDIIKKIKRFYATGDLIEAIHTINPEDEDDMSAGAIYTDNEYELKRYIVDALTRSAMEVLKIIYYPKSNLWCFSDGWGMIHSEIEYSAEEFLGIDYTKEDSLRFIAYTNNNTDEEVIDYFDVNINIYDYGDFSIADLGYDFKSTSLYRAMGKPERVYQFEQSSDIDESLVEKIVKLDNGKYQVQSEDGSKNLGTYDTKAEAEKRLKQVHYFKSVNETLKPVDLEGDDLVDADLIICDSPYQVKDFLTNEDFFKINYYPNKKFYVLIDPWNVTHFDVNKALKDNGWIDNIDENFERMAYAQFSGDIFDDLSEYSPKDFANMSYVESDDESILVCLDSPTLSDNELVRIFKQVSSRKGVLSDMLKESFKHMNENFKYIDGVRFFDSVYELKDFILNNKNHFLRIVDFEDLGFYGVDFGSIGTHDGICSIAYKNGLISDNPYLYDDNAIITYPVSKEKEYLDGYYRPIYVYHYGDLGIAEVGGGGYTFYNSNLYNALGKSTEEYKIDDEVESLQEDLQETDNEGNVLSKEQIEYFKDSKVRDRKGNLCVCYHGTNKDFNTFDKSLLGTGEGTVWGKGFYFFKGKDSEVNASEYGSTVKKVYVNITNPIKEEPEMFAKLLKFNYPEADAEDFEKFRERYWNDYNDEYILPLYVQRKLKVKVDDLEDLFLKMVTNAGYDGRIVDNEVICYEPNQIKSIDNKNPTNSDNINELLEMKGQARVSNQRVLDIVNRCIDKMRDIHYDFVDEDMLTFDDIDIEEGDSTRTFGTMYLPHNGTVIYDLKPGTLRKIMEPRKSDKGYYKDTNENLSEEMKNGKLIVYRVGQVDDFEEGLFFADSLDYYDHSDTGYSREDAEAYELDLSKAKIFDPMKEWDLAVNTWSDIRQEEEFFKEHDYPYYEYLDDLDYDDPDEYHEVITDTDYLALWAHEEGYDVVILRDIPGDQGYGDEQTEYCVFNKSLIRPVKLNESLFEEVEDKITLVDVDDKINYDDIHWWQNSETGEWNASIKVDDDYARLRAGILIVKDNKYVLLGEEKDEPGILSIPGGSLSKGETAVEAATREAQEEVKVNVKNARETDCNYCSKHTQFLPWVLENVPEEERWKHYYTVLVIADYDSEYKGKTDEVDEDPAMKNSSKWIEIEEAIKDDTFKDQWLNALIKFGYLDDDNNDNLHEKIVKKGSKWQVQSEKGKNLGTYDTKPEAEKRLQQVHYFKSLDEEWSFDDDNIESFRYIVLDNAKKYSKEQVIGFMKQYNELLRNNTQKIKEFNDNDTAWIIELKSNYKYSKDFIIDETSDFVLWSANESKYDNSESSEESEEEIFEREFYDHLKDYLVMGMNSGTYFGMNDFSKEELQYIQKNAKKTKRPLYRFENSFRLSKIGDIVDMYPMRSFTATKSGVDYIARTFDFDDEHDNTLYKTQGSTLYYSIRWLTQDDEYLCGEDEVFVWGRFKVVDISEITLNKRVFKLVTIEQIDTNLKEHYFKHMNEESLNESTGFPITVYTYQKPQVREQLEKGETYIADYNRSMFRDYDGYEDVKHPYKELVRVLGLSNCPIFGALTKEDLIRMLDASEIDWEEENILHLEIPKENLRYTEYYDWTDYIYALEEPEQFEEESGLTIDDLETFLKTQKSSIDYDLCQVVFDRIESKWYQDGKDEEEFLNEYVTNKKEVKKNFFNKQMQYFKQMGDMQKDLATKTTQEHEDDFDAVVDFCNNLQFPLKVYRGLLWKDKDEVRLDNLGVHWTIDEDFIKRNGFKTVIVGEVNEEDVDWKLTQNTYVYYSVNREHPENEIWLKKNAKPHNIKIYDIDEFNKEYESLNKSLKESKEDVYYRGYDSRYGVFDSNNKYAQLYTWVTDEPLYALEYAEANEFCKIAKVRITCPDKLIGGVLDLPEDVDYYDPGDEDFKEFILDEGLKGYGFIAGDYDDYCVCISKDCVEVIDPDVKYESEEESLNENIETFKGITFDDDVNKYKPFELEKGWITYDYDPNNEDEYYRVNKVYNIYKDNEYVGGIALDLEDESGGKVQALYIKPKYRKQGIGKTAVEFLKSKYSNLNLESLPKVFKFWQKQGFDMYGDDDVIYGIWSKNESLNESKQDIEKFIQWAGEDLANRFFKLKDRLS